MKRKNVVLSKLFLISALIIGLGIPGMGAQAATEPVVDVERKCGLKPMVQVELPENYTETEKALEKVYVSKEDIAYWTKFSSDYYYNTLTDAEKVWWDDMEMNCIAAAVGTEKILTVTAYADEEIGAERMCELIYYFMHSNKQYYFLANWFTSSEDYGSIGVYEEFRDGEARDAATEAFTSQIDAWVQEINTYSLPEEKEKAAHDIVCDNTVYEFNDFDQSAYSMVCLGETVCAGYAGALQTLLNGAGVDTITVTSLTHAWNVVNLHGYWYQVDATWDDYDGGFHYSFYNKSRQTFQDDNDNHNEEAEWTSVLTDAKYDIQDFLIWIHILHSPEIPISW